jgi:hypothetical protein
MSPEHTPQGDPCERCALPASRHRKRKRDRRAYDRGRGARKAARPAGPPVIIGIDGEGYTDARGRHRYTYMAASTAEGCVSELESKSGLHFEQVAEWLLSLPKHALLVGFSLGYDRAKWLQSLPDEVVYAVEHPELRSGEHGPMRVSYGDYLIGQLATKFSVACKDEDGGTVSKGMRGGRQRRAPKCRTRVVWDTFRFFQSSFVKALTKLDVGTPAERESIARMKEKRGSFAGITAEEKAYCQLECKLLAVMVAALFDAFEREGIDVRQAPYGPGAAAKVVLARMGAETQRSPVPDNMREAVESAYFGGRFELSHVGPVKGRLYGYDIASAYPFAMTRLPCMAHGRWEYTADPMKVGVNVACVSYRIEARPRACEAWGPLPHRLPDGNIVFPVESAGGWAWSVELRAAMKLHPGIVPMAAWVWRPSCSHAPPFASEVQRLYARRLELGKGARGIVLKLALNSLYGKSAQRVGGGGKFRCLVRAGLITATTRAMLLEAVALARDPWNVLELATDSVLSREPLALPPGTALGSWEEKPWPHGAFLIRPGMRFALGKDDHTAARGLGVKTLRENRKRILSAWRKSPMGELVVQQPSMFHGARSSVWRVQSDTWDADEALYEYRRSADYGQWTTPTPRALTYAPGPKRSGIVASPVVRGGIALVPWRLPPGLRSLPYQRGAAAEPDALDLRMFESEQPETGMLDVV